MQDQLQPSPVNIAFASPQNYKRQVFHKHSATRLVAEQSSQRYIVGRVFLHSAPHSLERTQFVACASITGVRLEMEEMLGEEFKRERFHEALAKGKTFLDDSFVVVEVLED